MASKDNVQFPVRLKPAQAAFWERKKKELARMPELQGKESRISNSTMFQGLVELWMALDNDGKRK